MKYETKSIILNKLPEKIRVFMIWTEILVIKKKIILYFRESEQYLIRSVFLLVQHFEEFKGEDVCVRQGQINLPALALNLK